MATWYKSNIIFFFLFFRCFGCVILPASRHPYTRRQLMVPQHRRSTFGRRAFSVAGRMEWNSLPHSLLDPARSTDSFRSALKTSFRNAIGTSSASEALRDALYKIDYYNSLRSCRVLRYCLLLCRSYDVASCVVLRLQCQDTVLSRSKISQRPSATEGDSNTVRFRSRLRNVTHRFAHQCNSVSR